jgi:hypothetical protein
MKVQIGSMFFDLIFTNKTILCNNHECYGAITYDDRLIEIKDKMCEDQTNQTIAHEIVHGITRERCLDELIDPENLEHIVDEFSKGLIQLLRDNPKLIAQLSKKPQIQSK